MIIAGIIREPPPEAIEMGTKSTLIPGIISPNLPKEIVSLNASSHGHLFQPFAMLMKPKNAEILAFHGYGKFIVYCCSIQRWPSGSS